MLVDHKIVMDLAAHNPTPIIHIKQGDVWAHAIVLTVYEAGEAWSGAWRIPASGGAAEVSAVVRYRKPDGYCGTYDKMPDGSPAVAVSGNTLTIALAPQLAAVPGMVDVDVQINAPQTAIATYTRTIAIFNIRLKVEAHPMNTQNVEGDSYECTTLQEINAALSKTVRTVNGTKPDNSGNVQVPVGVTAVNGKSGAVALAVNALATCASAGAEAVKFISVIDGFVLKLGATLAVKFTKTNTAENPRLSYGGNEMPIIDRITGDPIGASDISVGVYRFMLGPTGWILLDTQQTGGTAIPVPGDKGEDGGYWTPNVTDDGTLTWTPSKDGMGEAPAAANIKGPTGDQGPAGPKGDPGEIGPQGNPGKDGVTPNLQIGTVTTLPAGSSATAEITGTTANPMLNLGIPKGADATGGSIGVSSINGLTGAVSLPISGSCVCNSDASDKLKVLTSVSAGFDPSADGAILAVQFKSPGNAASGPELQIGQTVYTILHPGNLAPPAASALTRSVHHFSMRGSTRSAILLDPYVSTSTIEVDATLTQSGQAADAKIVGSALATRVPAAPLESDAGKVATVGSDGIPRWETLPAVGSLFGRCSTASYDAAKKVSYIDGAIVGGTIITVEFVNANEAENPILTANGVTGAIIGRTLAPISATDLTAGIHRFVCLSNYDSWLMLDIADGQGGEWTLLGEIDISAAGGGNIELTRLDGLAEFYVIWEQVQNQSATASGYNLVINGISVANNFVGISKFDVTPAFGWAIAKYNGLVWEVCRSNGANLASNVSLSSTNAILPYNHVFNVGAATTFKLSSPVIQYQAVAGTIRIYGR